MHVKESNSDVEANQLFSPSLVQIKRNCYTSCCGKNSHLSLTVSEIWKKNAMFKKQRFYLINKIAQEIRYTICLISYLNYGTLQIAVNDVQPRIGSGCCENAYIIMSNIYNDDYSIIHSTHVAPFTILWVKMEGFV